MKSGYRLHINHLTAVLILSCLCSLISTYAQSCIPEGITFSSQAQIDAFIINHPECTRISGAVLIEETTSGDIKNLNGLSKITMIGGFLDIKNNTTLSTLSGLEKLEQISGRLNILANRSLSSLNGLQKLTFIGESCRIASNQILESIDALSSIQKIAGNLSIEI